MMKICALNKDTEEESRSEEEVTKEALEQIALQQYAKALELHRNGNITDATQLLKDLLDTELLDGIRKPAPGEKVTTPLFNLKYLCYKNLASMLGAAGDATGGIEAYYAAAELDDTDVTLWHRLGLLCMRAFRYDEALNAFQRGNEINPKHWPCLDKILTLLLGLEYKEDCIAMCFLTLTLDPGYLRALAYRRYIYKNYPYVRDFMEYLSLEYKWEETADEEIDDEAAAKLLVEATEIHDRYLEQQKAEIFKHTMPVLTLRKPISKFTWEIVGNCLVDMHHYITENCFSHACYIHIVYENLDIQPMEVCEDVNSTMTHDSGPINKTDTDNDTKIISAPNTENKEACVKDQLLNINMNDEKIESDIEPASTTDETPTDSASETRKKNPTRRRGSALGFLQQWEWYYKRQPRRKKPNKEQERLDDNIYDILRSMIPQALASEPENNESMNTTEQVETNTTTEPNAYDKVYFGTEVEQSDVKKYVAKFSENKHDIIDMLKEFLIILAGKWKIRWSENLTQIFVEANKCYNTHIDPPLSTDDHHEDLLHYALVNLQVEEIIVNAKLSSACEEKHHQLCVTELIGNTLMLKPHIFQNSDLLELVLRYLWVKVHIHILNKNDDLALDCLNRLTAEFEAMGEHCHSYQLEVCNFSFKPVINETEIATYMNFRERNTRLSSVLELYDRGHYEAVLSIVLESFDHCKIMDREQSKEMSLDFAALLVVIIDSYRSLSQLDSCFKWSLICLHEALKHYFRYTSGTQDYEKWTLTVVKILTCMDEVLKSEGFSCMDSLSQKEISQGLEDLIRIIGHQVETNAAEMPFGTVIPWIILYSIIQREEDQGRHKESSDRQCGDVPNPLMLLFFGHEQLGNRGWCCQSDGKFLYFIMDVVVPRLRTPALSRCLEHVCQHMEQCIYCLYEHPGRKNKIKYLADHNATPRLLDWDRAQQVYEIFRPPVLPELEGKSGITADTEQLFLRIIDLLPAEYDPQKYVPDLKKYINGTETKLPSPAILLPYRMRDIFFLVGDYHFKREEHKLAIKYNTLDVVMNNDRFESWAQISLAKAVNLQRLLNSCKNLNNEKEYLNPAKSIIRCFKRTLQLDPTHCNILIEYGMFVYAVHSFCSRLLKQASESLSMDDFESLEKQKEELLGTTQKCFTAVLRDIGDDKDSEDAWLTFYMLGKVAEKRNRPPAEYLKYYTKGIKSLGETKATYPLKINYTTPAHLSIEVLELHYRIHATILKYIEQHENKHIPSSVGKVFATCIDEWNNGPFSKKAKKDVICEQETEPKENATVQAANIMKRSISDSSENCQPEAKKMKLEALAAKVKRSASYDIETQTKTTNSFPQEITNALPDKLESLSKENDVLEGKELEKIPTKEDTDKIPAEKNKNRKKSESTSNSSTSSSSDSNSSESSSGSSSDSSQGARVTKTVTSEEKPLPDEEIMRIVTACIDSLEDCASRFPPHYKAIYRLAHYHFYYKKGKDIERCRDLMLSTFKTRSGQKLSGLFNERKTSNFFNNIWKIPKDDVDRAGSFAFHMSRSVLLSMEILKEIDDHKTLLDLSMHLQRIPQADKKYLRDSDREELAQQALSLCLQSLKGQLLKFSQQGDLKTNEVERKVFNSLMLDIYRCYQRTQKQPSAKQFVNLLIDAYKLVSTVPITENMNLVDLSMKYCQSLIQTLKQQATQASRERSQNAQKKQTAKAAAVAASASMSSTTTKASMPKAPVASMSKAPVASTAKPPAASSAKPLAASTSQSQSKSNFKAPLAPAAPSLPKMSDMNPHKNYIPLMNDSTTAAALSYLSNMSALAGYTQTLQNTLQSPSIQNRLQNSFEAEFYRQLLSQSLSSFSLPPPAKKQKRAPRRSMGPKPSLVKPANVQSSTTGTSKPKSITSSPAGTNKPMNVPASTANTNKPSAANSSPKLPPPLAPSMGTVLATLPPSIASLSSYGTSMSSVKPTQAHASPTTTLPPPEAPSPTPQQTSPGKTLQEKLAERQKSSKPPQPPNAQKPANRKTDAKKALPLGDSPKPVDNDEVIVLDDD